MSSVSGVRRGRPATAFRFGVRAERERLRQVRAALLGLVRRRRPHGGR